MPKKQCMENFKLFGVQIDVAGDNGSTIRKSKSLENLHAFNPENDAVDESGYLSDGVIHQSSRAHDRKKGKPWSEEEHRSFLLGLEKLGKGNWKGIANNFVPSRDSSQVASHAQKYFIRKSGTEKKRRRPSVFDIPLDEKDQPSQAIPNSSSNKPAESSQNIGELKQAAIPDPVTVPEISPMKNPGIPYFYDMLYMPRVSGSAQSVSAQAVMPISWVPIPVMDFPGQRSVFLPSTVNRAFTICATSVPQPAAVTLRQASASTASSDELDLNIGELTL
ncbi:hypothetical protein BUALT_Bualt06G0136100 [Buddleja alternifolia]|uniref:Uncharacterized protein n=1 Tax=Buddleja alternifolia TaxID=168488 RepID=A0AAV6XR35_9LAMI|nr:hypothetical protein BUALT_Bualt06G0136100 [Buddleja alternifolia]